MPASPEVLPAHPAWPVPAPDSFAEVSSGSMRGTSPAASTAQPEPVGESAHLAPGTLAARLDSGARALGLELSPRQCTQLLDYLALLARWGRVYNLTAVRDPDQMLTQHLLDSLAVWPALRRECAARAGTDGSVPGGRLLDVGSGAGLPGVVLATLAPTWQVTCVDAVGKKVGFVRQAAAELGLANLRAAHARVEAMAEPGAPGGSGGFEVITSRAFAALADFVQASHRLLAPGGVWMAMKGQVPDAEMRALPAWAEVFHVEQLVVPGLQARRCLVWMRRRG